MSGDEAHRGARPSSPTLDHEPCALVDELEGRVLRLEAQNAQLCAAVGRQSTDLEHGAGLFGVVEQLQDTLGTAPNDATGDPGSGLCRVLAELARSNRDQGRSMAKALLAGSAGSLAVGQVLIEALRAWGLL